jgi:4-aminobutyrate aminotransferase-like enzyme
MRDIGVLIGRTDPEGNTLKIRPPLIISDDDAALLVRTIERAIRDELDRGITT